MNLTGERTLSLPTSEPSTHARRAVAGPWPKRGLRVGLRSWRNAGQPKPVWPPKWLPSHPASGAPAITSSFLRGPDHSARTRRIHVGQPAGPPIIGASRATGSERAAARLFRPPLSSIRIQLPVEPIQTIHGHARKTGSVAHFATFMTVPSAGAEPWGVVQ
jgi:hypothetical protein